MASKRRRTSEVPEPNRFLVLLEAIDKKVDAGFEGMASMERRLDARIDALEKSLTARIEALEIAVRRNSEDIRKNSEDIQRLKEQLAKLTDVVGGKVDARDFALLEARVAKLEARLGV